MSELTSVPCIERLGFLWFKQRRHEPLEGAELHLRHSYGPYSFTHPVHVRIDRTQTNAGRVVHVVGLVCRHCRRPYWERYESPEISWWARDEVDPERANEALARAHLWWRTGDLIHVTSYGTPIVHQDSWPIEDGDDRRAAVWEYLRKNQESEVYSCLTCGFPLLGKESERPCRACVAAGRAEPESEPRVNREAFLKP